VIFIYGNAIFYCMLNASSVTTITELPETLFFVVMIMCKLFHIFLCLSLVIQSISLLFVVAAGDVIRLVRLIFSTLTIAMRFEPANARFFSTEV